MKFFQFLPLLLVLSPVILRSGFGDSLQVESGSIIRCLEKEKQALLEFKDNLADTYGQLSSWGNEENKRDCCKWRGIQCHNQTNHVIRLNLKIVDSPLKGMISTSLLELQHLQYLDLSFNDFSSAPIPQFVGSLSELRHLNLYRANLGGPIPYHLGNLSKLSHLDLGGNQNCYSRSLDWVSHLHSLEYLDLSSTNLSKATNWLQAISKLTSIKELHVSGSELLDIPPSSLPSINASTSLATLDLSYNLFQLSTLALIHWFSNFSNTGLTSIDLSGNHMPDPILDVFEDMTSLAYLSLSKTGVKSGIPKYFGNMSSLIHLDLSRNNFTGELSELMMNLSGPIEKNLRDLWLNTNRISGSVCNMSRFSSLEKLTLGANQLNGSIQEGYLKLPHLLELDLSRNQLAGPVPDLSFSSSLKQLLLDNNKFNEISPQSIGRLPELEILFIGSNLFEGILTEAFMSNLSRLQLLDLSSNPSLTLKFSPHWVVPFRLVYLRLSHCRLGPHFPLWLKTQKEFKYIDISSAGISDVIPSWFGGVGPELTYLNASNNQMYGVFPDFSFSTIYRGLMMTLDLSRNKLSGSINFLCHTGEWGLIDLSDNLFFDQIPECFTHFEKLKYLNLANNNFSGQVPRSFGLLSALSVLHLRNNSFSGGLPTSMANCTNLEMIDLGENRLTGEIPAWIGDRFSRLKVLILRLNEFYGSIPSNLCGLSNIQILDLSSNTISGFIPNCVHKYTAMTRDGHENNRIIINNSVWLLLGYPLPDSTSQLQTAYFMWKGNEIKYANNLGLVKLIDLSSNKLSGGIPLEITKLVGLIGLNLSTNNLSGSIPYNIGRLKSLDSLDFSVNHLLGSIPTSLGELSFLGILNLSYNNLSGRIPSSPKLLTFDASAYMGNPGMCGIPLNKSCPGDESHQDSDSRSNDGNNSMSKPKSKDDEFITKEFYISLGLGFIVGFWGIFGTILFNRTGRYAFLKVYNIVEDFVYVRAKLTKTRLLRHFQDG